MIEQCPYEKACECDRSYELCLGCETFGVYMTENNIDEEKFYEQINREIEKLTIYKDQ